MCKCNLLNIRIIINIIKVLIKIYTFISTWWIRITSKALRYRSSCSLRHHSAWVQSLVGFLFLLFCLHPINNQQIFDPISWRSLRQLAWIKSVSFTTRSCASFAICVMLTATLVNTLQGLQTGFLEKKIASRATTPLPFNWEQMDSLIFCCFNASPH